MHACSSSVLSIAICIMATSSAWLSILVKRGQDIVKPRTVVKCSWEETFGALFDKLDLPETTIEKVQISANEKFIDPVHVVPIDAPVCLCDQFKCMHVCISIEAPARRMNSRHTSRPNAFDVLMAASREIVVPSKLTPPEGKQLRKDQQLCNDLLGRFATRARTHTHTHAHTCTHAHTHTSHFHVFCSSL